MYCFQSKCLSDIFADQKLDSWDDSVIHRNILQTNNHGLKRLKYYGVKIGICRIILIKDHFLQLNQIFEYMFGV